MPDHPQHYHLRGRGLHLPHSWKTQKSQSTQHHNNNERKPLSELYLYS